MEIDTAQVDQAVRAVLHLALHDRVAAWESIDWEVRCLGPRTMRTLFEPLTHTMVHEMPQPRGGFDATKREDVLVRQAVERFARTEDEP